MKMAAVTAAIIFLAPVAAYGQAAGVVRGIARDAHGAVIAGAMVTLSRADDLRYERTDREGRFTFFNVPFGPYLLSASQTGFATVTREVLVQSSVPVDLELVLVPSGLAEEVTVMGEAAVKIGAAASEYGVDRESLRNIAGALPSRQMETLILSVPGTARDGKGVFHARGAHYQASVVIDGVPVSDQLSTIYANNFDARNAEDLNVQLGSIPPEFGNKVSAVIQVTTRSGLGAGKRLFGELSSSLGSFASGEAGFKLGGESRDRRWGYFVSGAFNRSSRFVDPPFQNAQAIFADGRVVTASGRGLHNTGASQNLFARFDFVPDDRNFFKLNLVAARSRFGVPNLPSQQLNGQDQKQENRNLAIYPSWQRAVGGGGLVTIAPYLRLFTAGATSSAGDTPISFDYGRRLATYGLVASYAHSTASHQFKTGLDLFAFPVSERFDFEITDASYNPLPVNSRAIIRPDGQVEFFFDPRLSEEERCELLLVFNPNLVAYDRTIYEQARASGSVVQGAVRRFTASPRRTGRQFSFYVQGTSRRGAWTLSGGVRIDRYAFLVRDSAISPRLGVAYRVPLTGTVVRASYNRIAQTPSTENLLISESPEAASLVNPETVRRLGARLRFVPLERANWYEAGAQHLFGRRVKLDVAYYAKRIRNIHDNDQFLNTTIIFPIALARGRVDGLDLSFDARLGGGVRTILSLGTVRARVRPPFAGGLFLSGATPEDFGDREFVIDHDQKLNLQTAIQYVNERLGLFAQFLVRHDSGLVTGVSAEDVPALLADPDTAAGVPLLDFTEEPVRVRARTTFDVSVGYDLVRSAGGRVRVQFDALNLTNRLGLYNFLSVFGGTNYAPPRALSVQVKYIF
jgi:hypothetical protein